MPSGIMRITTFNIVPYSTPKNEQHQSKVPAKENAGVNHHPGFKKHLPVFAASTLFIALVYTLFPVCAQRGTAPDRANSLSLCSDQTLVKSKRFSTNLICLPVKDNDVDHHLIFHQECTDGIDCNLQCLVFKIAVNAGGSKLPTCFVSKNISLSITTIIIAAIATKTVCIHFVSGVMFIFSCIIFINK